MRQFTPGETVSFTSDGNLIIGEVEEVRRGHEGDNLLVVRQGSIWSGAKSWYYLAMQHWCQANRNSILQ